MCDEARDCYTVKTKGFEMEGTFAEYVRKPGERS